MPVNSYQQIKNKHTLTFKYYATTYRRPWNPLVSWPAVPSSSTQFLSFYTMTSARNWIEPPANRHLGLKLYIKYIELCHDIGSILEKEYSLDNNSQQKFHYTSLIKLLLLDSISCAISRPDAHSRISSARHKEVPSLIKCHRVNGFLMAYQGRNLKAKINCEVNSRVDC